MPWDLTKCPHKGPVSFTNVDAQAAVTAADFTQSVYVNISAATGGTKQAYTYCDIGDWIICVVGHAHKDRLGFWTRPGNCFIPGWAGWQMNTPALKIAQIAGAPVHGVFPDGLRYPRPAMLEGLNL